ncbi:UNVERIFIED_ORG: hypothetical protein J2Y77_004706 [Pseudomonas lini]
MLEERLSDGIPCIRTEVLVGYGMLISAILRRLMSFSFFEAS